MGCLCGDVRSTTGVPQIAADLPRCTSRQALGQERPLPLDKHSLDKDTRSENLAWRFQCAEAPERDGTSRFNARSTRTVRSMKSQADKSGVAPSGL
jgi:hypothetical protein